MSARASELACCGGCYTWNDNDLIIEIPFVLMMTYLGFTDNDPLATTTAAAAAADDEVVDEADEDEE